MPRELFFFQLPLSPRGIPFEFNGSIDANIISFFANMHQNIRVEVRVVPSIPNSGFTLMTAAESKLADKASQYIVARFNMDSTGATPGLPGMFPGDEAPVFYTREIFNQDRFPICICFRTGDSGSDIALLFFNKREGKIEGRIQEGYSPRLIQIRALIDGLRSAAPDVRPLTQYYQ